MSQAQPQISADGRFYWDGQAWKPIGAASAASVSRVQGLVVLAGGILIVLGTFLPWVSASAPFVGTITRSLMDGGGDGFILSALGGVVLLLGLTMTIRGPEKWAAAVVILPLAIAAVTVFFDYGDMAGRVANVTSQSSLIIASVGPGPYVSGFGVLVGAVGSVMALVRGRGEKPIPPEPTSSPAPPDSPAGASSPP